MCQGYRTENQLAYFKKCTDYHKSWDSVCNIYRKAMVMLPYVKSHSDLSVGGYITWAKQQRDSLYQIKYEQVIIDFWIHINIQHNNNNDKNNKILFIDICSSSSIN